MPRVRRATPRPRPQVICTDRSPRGHRAPFLGTLDEMPHTSRTTAHVPKVGWTKPPNVTSREGLCLCPAPDSGGLAAEPGAGQGASLGTRPRWCRVKCQGKLWEVPRQIPERLLAPAYNTGSESDAEHPHRGSHATLGARHQVLSGCLWLGRALLGTLLSPEGGVVTH